MDEQRELARQIVSSQWGLVVAAKGNVAAGKKAVEATRIALKGVRDEEKLGQRTLLDVLNSEQAYLNAHVNLVSYKRDLVAASYGVLAAMGRLTAYDIALEAELYDPTRYYGEVKDAWFGWGLRVKAGRMLALRLLLIPDVRLCNHRPMARLIPRKLHEHCKSGEGQRRVDLCRSGSGAGLIWPCRRRPHSDLEAALTCMGSRENRHGGFRPNDPFWVAVFVTSAQARCGLKPKPFGKLCPESYRQVRCATRTVLT